MSNARFQNLGCDELAPTLANVVPETPEGQVFHDHLPVQAILYGELVPPGKVPQVGIFAVAGRKGAVLGGMWLPDDDAKAMGATPQVGSLHIEMIGAGARVWALSDGPPMWLAEQWGDLTWPQLQRELHEHLGIQLDVKGV